MAMFDYVRSEIALPDGWMGELRTRAFGCALDTLLIRADGRLLMQVFEQRDVATVQQPISDWGGMAPPPGSLRSAVVRWRDLAFNGEFELYSPPTDHAADGLRRRYKARFDSGQLVSISLED